MSTQNFLHRYFKTSKYLVFEQKLSEWSFKTADNPEIICDPVEKEEFLSSGGKFKEIMPNALERFEIGDICYGARINNQYAHLKWIAFNRSYVSEIESLIHLPSDSVYLYDGFTLPEYRGLRLTSIVLDKTFQFLSEIGIKRAYSFILPTNWKILKSKERENARKIGLISFYKIFGFKIVLVHGETKEDKRSLASIFKREIPRIANMRNYDGMQD